MAPPQISVVIPTKNRMALLRETLDSVRAQSLTCWECVVVDDGSSDGTEAELARRVAADPRLRYVRRTARPAGANACRNIGIHETSADLIVFLDSDDLLAPDCLRQRVEAMEERSVDFAVFPGWVFTVTPGDAGRLFARDVPGGDMDRFLFLDYPWEISAPVWRRRALESLGGFDEALPSWQDIDLHVRALAAGLTYVKTGSPDHHIRWSGGLTRTSAVQFADPVHLQSGERLVRSFHQTLARAALETPLRKLALGGLFFLLAERWTRAGRLGQAHRAWRQARKNGLVSASLYWKGILILLVFKAGLLPRDYNERLLERFRIAVGFRFEPNAA